MNRHGRTTRRVRPEKRARADPLLRGANCGRPLETRGPQRGRLCTYREVPSMAIGRFDRVRDDEPSNRVRTVPEVRVWTRLRETPLRAGRPCDAWTAREGPAVDCAEHGEVERGFQPSTLSREPSCSGHSSAGPQLYPWPDRLGRLRHCDRGSSRQRMASHLGRQPAGRVQQPNRSQRDELEATIGPTSPERGQRCQLLSSFDVKAEPINIGRSGYTKGLISDLG